MTHDQLIDRIRKLYASEGRTPAELRAMHDKARELMKRHNITRAEVFARPIKQVENNVPVRSRSTSTPVTVKISMGGLTIRWRL